MNTIWVGIDVSKANLMVAAFCQETSVTLGEWENTPTGFDALAEQLQRTQEACHATVMHLVVEPTGGYAP
jgi:hypothetical protein